tara:strand:- start:240 stop:581 length:342 start_codon:yes stop_codon:yes gene_type:complete
MTKTKEKSVKSLNRKQTQLIINGCDLLDHKSQLSSDWNRIIKPELVLLFEQFQPNVNGLSVIKNKYHYQINRNVKEYNMFDSESFKKSHFDLFKKFSKKNIRTNWTYSIKTVL